MSNFRTGNLYDDCPVSLQDIGLICGDDNFCPHFGEHMGDRHAVSPKGPYSRKAQIATSLQALAVFVNHVLNARAALFSGFALQTSILWGRHEARKPVRQKLVVIKRAQQ